MNAPIETKSVWVGSRCREMTQEQIEALERKRMTPEQRIADLEARVAELERRLAQ